MTGSGGAAGAGESAAAGVVTLACGATMPGGLAAGVVESAGGSIAAGGAEADDFNRVPVESGRYTRSRGNVCG